MENKNIRLNCQNKEVFKHGPSSYAMHDPKIIFDEINLKEGYSFLDLGCGSGDYALKASEIVGESGRVYALDRNKEVLDGLKERIRSKNIENVKVLVADISKKLPLDDNSVDACLIATVLHMINLKNQNPFSEIKRILKPEGILVTVDCKKEDFGFGPPLKMRLCEEEVEKNITAYGFKKVKTTDLGYNYMIQFKPE